MRRLVFIGLAVCFAIVNAINTIQTLLNAGAIAALGVSYPVPLRALSTLLWAVVFAGLVSGLIFRWQRARQWVAPLLTAYGAWGVLWLILFAQSDYGRGRIGFQVLLTGIALLPVWWLHIRS